MALQELKSNLECCQRLGQRLLAGCRLGLGILKWLPPLKYKMIKQIRELPLRRQDQLRQVCVSLCVAVHRPSAQKGEDQ